MRVVWIGFDITSCYRFALLFDTSSQNVIAISFDSSGTNRIGVVIVSTELFCEDLIRLNMAFKKRKTLQNC